MHNKNNTTAALLLRELGACQGNAFGSAMSLWPLGCGCIDASTLWATASNVGMNTDNSHSRPSRKTGQGHQDESIKQLARGVEIWLEKGNAVVGINEINFTIKKKQIHQITSCA